MTLYKTYKPKTYHHGVKFTHISQHYFIYYQIHKPNAEKMMDDLWYLYKCILDIISYTVNVFKVDRRTVNVRLLHLWNMDVPSTRITIGLIINKLNIWKYFIQNAWQTGLPLLMLKSFQACDVYINCMGVLRNHYWSLCSQLRNYSHVYGEMSSSSQQL